MRILYIAYSCDPLEGSEDRIGWSIPLEASKKHEVYVITKEEHRKRITEYFDENENSNLKFYFIDIPIIYKKIFDGYLYSGRLSVWNKRAYQLAKSIVQNEKIEIIHQITPIEFRSIGEYGKINNVKFVCGPVGGAELLPRQLEKYAKGHESIEFIRKIVNLWSKIMIKAKKNLNFCDLILYANTETKNYLCSENVVIDNVVTETGISERDFSEIPSIKNYNNKIVFLVAGRIVYRKGHSFLLDAISKVNNKDLIEIRIVGDGKDKNRLQKKCSELEIDNIVNFIGEIPFSKMEEEYKNASALIMPSLRETTGAVVLEAMAKGVPVITINRFGAKNIIDEKTGWLYDGNSEEALVSGLAKIIDDCVISPSVLSEKGLNAQLKARNYTWDKKFPIYEDLYMKIITEQ